MLILNVLQGPDKGKVFELPDTEPQQIGRSTESLPLTDTTISRRHAELTPDDGNWILNDLKSANGTFVNGIRIEKQTVLKPGDQIRTGATLFVFGRAPNDKRQSVRMLGSKLMDSAVESTVPSNDDSVMMVVQDPSENLKLLYELMQVVGSTFDRKELLEKVMDMIFENFEPDRGFILLLDEDQTNPEAAVIRYRQQDKDEENQLEVSKTIVQHVLDKAEGVLSSNAMADYRFGPSDSVRTFGIRSAICVPIIAHDKKYGVIYVDSQVANYTFTEEQLRLMTAMGVQTAIALENAHLYTEGMQQERMAAMGETVASLSHSIKNILQAMRGGAEVVELGLRRKDLEVVGNGWGILSRNLDRIYELTMNMLTYAKQRQPEIEIIQLPTLLEEIIELYTPQYERRNVALITDIDSDLPPIPVDTGGFHQALTNLMSNALDAVEPSSGIVTLRCEFKEDTQEALVSVSDNGHGIEPEDLRRLFKPFYSTKGLRGTGLGLPVTKKIVEEHMGRITVDSKPGEGTTFNLFWPASLKHDPGATEHG